MAQLQHKNRIIREIDGAIHMAASNDDTKIFIIDEDDYDRVKNYRWNIKDEYITTTINYRRVYLHRFIKNAVVGVTIDHINGNKLDNQKINLRECTVAQNGRNRGKQVNNTSGYKGVIRDKRCDSWQAQITYTNDGVKNRLSKCFPTALEAARQYNIWAREYHGEFAVLNDI